MSKSKHIRICLTEAERTQLQTLITSGNAPARTQTRARILLLSDRSVGPPKTEAEIAAVLLCKVLLCNKNTVGNIRRRCAEAGVDAALVEKPRPGALPKMDGEAEAKITLLACSTPPLGKARWTLRLLASQAIELGYVDSISHVTVGERLKKTNSRPGR